MTAGFMKDGKFHPINQSNGGSRKKRLDFNDPELLENFGVKISRDSAGHNIRMKRDKQDPQGLKLMNMSELRCVTEGSPCATESFLHVYHTTHVSPELQEKAKKLLRIRQVNDINRHGNKGKPKIQQIPILDESISRLSRDRETINLPNSNTIIYKDTGETLEDDSLHGRGHFEKLNSGQWVFVPIKLSSKQQKASVDIANGNIKDTDMFDISEVFLVSSATIPDKFRGMGRDERITTGKEVKRIIARNVKRYGWIPAYNVSKVIKPI